MTLRFGLSPASSAWAVLLCLAAPPFASAQGYGSRNAVRLHPSFAPGLAALGRILRAKNDFQAALSELNAAIQLDPKSPALRSRGLLYLSLGQPGQALRDFDQVIANDGNDRIAYADRGVAKARLGDPSGAIGDYTRSLQLAPAAAVYIDRGNAQCGCITRTQRSPTSMRH